MKNPKPSPAEPECEERYRLLTENAGDTIWAVDLTGKLTYISPSVEGLCGFTPAECLARSLNKALTPASMTLIREDTQKIIAEAASGEPLKAHRLELEFIHKDGTSVWAEATSNAMFNAAGELVGIQGISRDITERKRAEEALQRSEARFHTIFAQSPAGIELYDAGGKLIDVNPACLEIFGVESADVVRGFDLFTDPNLPTEARSRLEQGEPVQYETAFNFELVRQWVLYPTTRSGQCFLNCLIAPLHGPDHSITGYLVHVQDITDRMRAEEALRESETRYRQLVDKTDTGFVVVDDQGIVIEANEPYMRLIGAEKLEEITGHSVIEWTAPEAQESNTASVALCARQGFIQDFETIYTHRNGSRLHININATTHETPDGKRLISFCRNITKRKQMEEALRESEMRLRTVIEAVQEGITFSDKKGYFEAYNSRMEKLTGYSADEANASSDFTTLLYPDPKDREKALAGLSELTTIGMSREAETKIRTKDGTQKHILVSTTLIPYKNQRMFLSSYHDITERKLLEAELRRQSIVDELTGLFNRRGFLTLAEQQLKFAERAKKSLILFFMDLDHMKWINDTMGHREGDRALIEIATVLLQTFRKSDIIGRMGGDEFAVLAIDTAHEVGQTVARLCESLDSFNQSKTRTYKLSLSLGTAHFDPDNPSSLDDLMARADNLMYREKRTKRQIRHGS
ncbi:MAG: PAS domain S-box protein [Deltaproteobacteria bacterium]|nr:PAS domain S-box protein [Deltaproteobacteria bacterium]